MFLCVSSVVGGLGDAAKTPAILAYLFPRRRKKKAFSPALVRSFRLNKISEARGMNLVDIGLHGASSLTKSIMRYCAHPTAFTLSSFQGAPIYSRTKWQTIDIIRGTI